jgi:hypothetical protein
MVDVYLSHCNLGVEISAIELWIWSRDDSVLQCYGPGLGNTHRRGGGSQLCHCAPSKPGNDRFTPWVSQSGADRRRRVCHVRFLEPSEYSLTVVKTGFAEYRIDRLVLQVRDRQTLRLQLKINVATQTEIEVNARAEAFSSDVAEGTPLDQQYIQNLPLNGRNAESLILLAPGITSPGGAAGDFNANGLRSNTNYYTLDGVSLNRPVSGGGGGGFGGPGGGGPPPGGSRRRRVDRHDKTEHTLHTAETAGLRRIGSTEGD